MGGSVITCKDGGGREVGGSSDGDGGDTCVPMADSY